jgi:hypothetical protein
MDESRTIRDFFRRSLAEQELLLHATCCESCDIVNFRMLHPEEYEIGHEVFLSGFCPQCHQECITEIIEQPRLQQ